MRQILAILCFSLFATSYAAPVQEVNLWVSRNVAPSTKIRVNLNSRNVPVVTLSAYPIDGVAWLKGMGQKKARPNPTGPKAVSWETRVAGPNQRPNPNQADTYYSRQINLPLMKPGVYLVTATGGAKEAWGVVNVTNLAVVAKRAPKRLLVWVTDARSGKIVPGASVTAFKPNGPIVARGTTGADGVTLFPIAPGSENLVVQRGHDFAGIPSAVEDPNGKLRAHFQTDRPIYRPGQTVFFKAILRRTQGQGFGVVANTPCSVQVRDGKDTPLEDIKLRTNAMGTVNGRFEIPSEGMTGPYSMVLTVGNDTAYQTFTVAEYRKPEFKVTVRPTVKRALAGETVEFQVSAETFFGTPVPGAKITYEVRSNPMAFSPRDASEDWFYGGDGNLYARDTYEAKTFVANDVASTDAKGNATILIKTDKAVPDATYAFSCTVEDASRRQVTGGASLPVFASTLRLGLSSPVSYTTLGSLIPVTVQAVDWNGAPAAARVTLQVKAQEWNEKKEAYQDRLLTQTEVRVPSSGRLTVNLPAKQAGPLTIVATTKDATGRTTSDRFETYVAGNFKQPVEEEPTPEVGVRLDKRAYRPGEAVKAFVTTNIPGHPMLLIAEGEDIWGYKVVPASGRGQAWTIPTNLAMAPNAYVSAMTWVKGQFAEGNAIVPVPDPSRRLTVKVTPDKKEYRPGDQATYSVQTLDHTGRGVPAEVALSVVDEAIYALSPDVTPDPYRMYWGQRPNLVTVAVSMPEELSGGAYQRVGTVAPVRQRFEDTALWSPMVATGPDGTAKVSLEMPGNLTAWRATARAIGDGTSVGSTTATVQARRPVMLRLATPRQMVQGDRVTLIGTVDNRDEVAHEFEVSLAAEGLKVDGPTSMKVTVPARSQAKVEWPLDAASLPADGKAVLTAQIAPVGTPNPDLSDALRVSLPVVPNGLRERIVEGGAMKREAVLQLELPKDRIEPATEVRIEVRGGLDSVLQETAKEVLSSPRYGTVGAANHLVAAAATWRWSQPNSVREDLALLSRTQQPDGWGWWESSPADPVITSRVVSALGYARLAGVRIYDNLLRAAQQSAIDRANQTNLWEHRALLAAAAAIAGEKRGLERIDEVLTRGAGISPFAKLRTADALALSGRREDAADLVGEVLKLASIGPTSAFIPTSEGPGWTATTYETTAEALAVLARLDADRSLQARFARWLALPDETRWLSMDEQAAMTRGLGLYAKHRPLASGQVGDTVVSVNGQIVPTQFTSANLLRVVAPRQLFRDGKNEIRLRQSGAGESFYTVEARIFRPAEGESTRGVRVLRRFEVQNPAGVWVELDRAVRPSEPVRCTVVAWGDDVADAVRVVEPLPAGFEYVDGDDTANGRQEVRDGAVVHYLLNDGSPQTFRYYLRAEADGDLVALPATAEYLRRPSVRGQSSAERLKVKG